MTSAAVTRFYTDTGQHLIEEQRYPTAIAAYRRRENEIAIGVASFYQVTVEVGCMSGCLLYEVLRDLPLAYVGLDLVEGSIATLRERIAKEQNVRALRHALTLDVLEIDRLADMLVPGRTVAMFPFNSFGNLPAPLPVLDALAKAGVDIWIGTYDTSEEMTAIRREYYDAAGIGAVDAHVDESGVMFTSEAGLRSCAYSEEWLRRELGNRHYEIDIVREDGKFVFAHGRLRKEN
jgi:hypothetical protein